ncbi:MAG: methyl-accepting chemotaxis protein [Bacteroidota bacterium]
MKTQSIKTKIAISVGAIILLTIIIITTYSTIVSRNNAIESAKKEMIAVSQNGVEKIKSIVDKELTKLEIHLDDLTFIKELDSLDRTKIGSIYENILKEDENVIGFTVCYEPGKFDGKNNQYRGYPGYYADGRFSEYFYREDGEILRDDLVTSFEKSLIEEGSDWWEIPKKLKENYVFMDIYNVKGRDVLMLSTTVPILENGEYIGVLCKDFISEFVQIEALKAKESLFDGECEVSVYDQDGMIAADTEKPDYIGKKVKDLFAEESDNIINKIKEGKQETYLENGYYVSHIPMQFDGTGSNWQFNVSVPKSVIVQRANSLMVTQIIIGLFAILLSIFIVIFVINKLLSPLNQLIENSNEISKGNLEINFDIERGDEIGMLSKAFSNMTTKLKSIIENIIVGSNNITATSSELSGMAQQISQGASEQSASVEEVSATLEQITSNIEQNNNNANVTEKISILAQSGMTEVNNQAKKAVEANKQISEKISIITDIAFQTNILALNAAVEAARAGEQGKGFAVVASEVRKLAERSKVAADEIVSLAINSSYLTEEAGNKIQEMLPEIEKTTGLVKEIAVASNEQTNGANQVNSAVQQLNDISQQSAASSEELATSAEEMNSQAEKLKELIAYFKIGKKEEEMKSQILKEVAVEKPIVEKTVVNKPVVEINKEFNTKGVKLDLSGGDRDDADFESF